jgi:BirA family transcriptional regulator, biotin operon repressor / biotin---[acetyl-CoA-carboxylase] ligase
MEFVDPNVKHCLEGRAIGHTVHFLTDVDSTNTLAFELASRGAEEGTVVIADHQSRGKGRLNRTWQSPPSSNLYLSVILRPDLPPSVAPQMTLVAGVAMTALLLTYCPGAVILKWPNDVLIGGKKVCGILAEMKASSRGLDFVILGIGLNVNMLRQDFDETFRSSATSLREETGRVISRLNLLQELAGHLEIYYFQWLREGFAPIRRRWLECSDLMNKWVKVVFKDEIQQGRVVGLDADGALLLRDEQENILRILAGDASIMRNS